MVKKILSATLFFCFYISFSAYCGWPIRPHRLLLSPSVSYFRATSDWDKYRNVIARPNDGSFSSTSFYMYGEYGINRRLAVTASVPYISYALKDTSSLTRVSGVSDMEVGVRYYLANINYKYYFTIQGTAIVPLYNTPNLGYAQNGAELKLGFAGAGKIGSKFFSLNVENAVRQYLGENGPIQDRINVSFGITLDKQFHDQLTLGASGMISASSIKTFTRNIYTTRDFGYTQISLSYGHSFNSKVSLFLSAGQFVVGQNTGIGTTGSASLIFKIDNAFDRKLNY